jgi:hypothetical protein
VSRSSDQARRHNQIKEYPMSRTTSLGRLPSESLFGRFFTLIETTIDKVAVIAARNGDQPYFGL